MVGIWLVSYIVLWLSVLTLFVGLVAVLRQIGLLQEQSIRPSIRRTKLRRGEKLPEVKFMTLAGQPARLSEVLAAPTPLVIVSSGCSGCGLLLKQLAGGEFGEDAVKQVIILSVASVPDTESLLRQAEMPLDASILVDAEGGVRRVWGVHTTPTTIHVDENLIVLEQNLGFFNGAVLGNKAIAHTGNGHMHHPHVPQEERELT